MIMCAGLLAVGLRGVLECERKRERPNCHLFFCISFLLIHPHLLHTTFTHSRYLINTPQPTCTSSSDSSAQRNGSAALTSVLSSISNTNSSPSNGSSTTMNVTVSEIQQLQLQQVSVCLYARSSNAVAAAVCRQRRNLSLPQLLIPPAPRHASATCVSWRTWTMVSQQSIQGGRASLDTVGCSCVVPTRLN